MSQNEIEINLDDLKKEISSMDEKAVREQLMGLKVRQKVQQKKQQEKGSQKVYQAKQREKAKLLKEAALALGIYDSINEEAEKLAAAKFEQLQKEEAEEAAAPQS